VWQSGVHGCSVSVQEPAVNAIRDPSTGLEVHAPSKVGFEGRHIEPTSTLYKGDVRDDFTEVEPERI
jgi:hypothetical protein